MSRGLDMYNLLKDALAVVEHATRTAAETGQSWALRRALLESASKLLVAQQLAVSVALEKGAS